MSVPPASPSSFKSTVKRLVSLAISILLLAVLISTVDRGALLEVLAAVHLAWLVAGLLLFIPQILAIAHRWRLIAEPVARIHPREAGRQIVASNCLNLVLPSKLGDLAKGVFLHRQGRCRLRDGLQIVVFEKLLDLAALSAWMIAGWVLAPSFAWWVLVVLALGMAIVLAVAIVYFLRGGAESLLALMPGALRSGKPGEKIASIIASAPRVANLVHAVGGRRRALVGWSFLIWFLHLIQIFCFFQSVGVKASLFEVLARVPIAIFAGLLPLSIAGVGVRDWAIVAIFESAANPRPVLVAAGLLVSLRYVVPALTGLPFVPRYFLMSKAIESKT